MICTLSARFTNVLMRGWLGVREQNLVFFLIARVFGSRVWMCPDEDVVISARPSGE